MNVQPPSERKRGAVLLISLAILALLSLFALTFVKLVNFERKASANYTDAVRARMLARAGIRRAVVELQDIAGLRHYSDPRTDGWVYDLVAPTNMSQAQRDGLNLKLNLMLTTAPSFKMTNLGPIKGNPDPNLNRCDGDPHTGGNCASDPVSFRSPLAVSGYLGKSYENGMDVYKLKILDSASQVNLNHPDRASAQRMLKNLIRCVADDFAPAWTLNDAQADAIAAHVILNRPTSGFRSKAQIQDLLMVDPTNHLATCPCMTITVPNGGLSLAGITATNRVTEDRWQQGLRDRVTVHSWIDEKVIHPWNLNPDLINTHEYYEPPRRGLPLMRRAPININTATKPVLVALLAGVEARNDYGTFKVGYTNARLLADEIIAWRTSTGSVTVTSQLPVIERGPFKSWLQFEMWLDHQATITVPAVAEPGPGGSPYIVSPAGDANYQGVKTPAAWAEGLVPLSSDYRGVSPTWKALDIGQGIRDTIKAQLNPNTILNKFGQGANHGGRLQYGMPIARLADKSDLASMSTEGCFDSMGVFEITSLGMVLQQDTRLAESLTTYLGGTTNPNEMGIIAAQTQQVVIRVYDVVRFTTQDDFERFRAMMAPGDFIPDKRAWRNLPGVNRASNDIMESNGWPSLITQPVYSISRDDTNLYNIDGVYTPAQYDGHMTLTNLLGVDAQPWDFIAGFARGTTQAFKCRVWWDPKDQNPFPSAPTAIAPGWPFNADPLLPAHSGNPSHPRGIMPPADVPTTEIENWYAPPPGNFVPPSGLTPQLGELSQLCTPLVGADPRTEGKVSLEKTPFDGKLGDAVCPTHGGSPGVPPSCTADGTWWHEGSSLWNNGVALGPRRTDDAGNPLGIAYEGNNMNLERASSIRVWVQPLVDPYLREDEVLLSFVGSNGTDGGNAGGIKREVGFRVVKRAVGSSVSIALQACPSNNANNDAYPPGHPYSGKARTNPGLPNTTQAINEWGWFYSDGSDWKDVVEIDVTPDVATRFSGSPAWKALNPLEPEWVQNSWHWVVVNYGYARDEDMGSGLGFAQFDMSLQVDMSPTQPPRVSNPVEGIGRIAFMGDPGVGVNNDGFGELHGHEAFTTVDQPFQALGSALGWSGGTVSLPNSTAIHLWLEPRPLGDYYNCRRGGMTIVPTEIEYPGVVVWDATLGSYSTSQPINFPPQSYAHQVFLRWPDGTREPMFWNSSGANAVAGNWSYVFTPPFDPGPLDIIVAYKEAIPASVSPTCRAVESAPGAKDWDGAAMKTWQMAVDAGLNPPDPGNGDNQCVSMAEIHGRAPSIHVNDGYPCWTISNSSMTGQGAVIAVPGYGSGSTIPPHFVCDGCRGCENCDVDAPLFIGGEPRLNTNYTGTTTSPLDPDTMAFAVFDNLVIKNKREFEARTDYTSGGGFIPDVNNPGFEIPDPSGGAGTTNAPVDWYEDRFFETTTASEHLDLSGEDPAQGFGATYRRGLLELIGSRTRVGSMTWTSYPTSDGRMQYEVGLKTLPGKDAGGLNSWRGDNTSITGQTSYVKDVNGADARSQIVSGTTVTGYEDGLQFGSQTYYDGLGDATRPYDILMLNIQLGNLYKIGGPVELTGKQEFGFNTSISDAAVLPSTAGGLPTPITESPVFEDVTINLLRETPQYLYAEEGVNE